MIKLVLLLLLFNINFGYAKNKADELHKVQINLGESQSMMQYMLIQLAEFPLTNYTQAQILDHLSQINKHLKGVSPSTINSFFLTQFYKVLFDFSNSDQIDASNVQISAAHLSTALEKFNKNKKIMGKFPAFLIYNMIKNYNPFKKNNYLNNYLNSSNRKFNKPKLRKKINLLNKHLGPWIMLFLKYDSKKYNEYCSGIIKNYIESLAYVSKFFFFQKLHDKGVDIFTHPKGDLTQIKSNLLNAIPKSDKKNDADLDPKEVIENLTLDPGTAAEEKIDKIINNLDQNKN